MRMEFEISPDEAVSDALDRAVSAIEDRDPTETRPFVHIVDPDALDALFADQPDGTPRTGGRLTVQYDDCEIVVEGEEFVAVECP